MTKLDITNFLNQACIYIIYDLIRVYLRCKKWYHDVIQLNTCEWICSCLNGGGWFNGDIYERFTMESINSRN